MSALPDARSTISITPAPAAGRAISLPSRPSSQP